MKTRWMILSLLAGAVTIMAGDIPGGPFAGTWKCNVAKSKFPGPPPQSESFTIDPGGKVTISAVHADGTSSTWWYRPQAGKAVPVEGRGPNVTVTVRQVNSHRMEHTWSYDGRPAKSYSILSEDGKTQTFHIEGTGKDGKPFEETLLYEKQ